MHPSISCQSSTKVNSDECINDRKTSHISHVARPFGVHSFLWLARWLLLCTELETARGTLGQPRSFGGRLGVFVMSLWQCWFIQLDWLDSKLQPFLDQYADAKQHCDHASPKMAFQFARAAIWNLSRHSHRNLDKEGTIINTARMRS